MTLSSMLVCALLVNPALAARGQTPFSGRSADLRWVRGVVVGLSADSLSLKLRDRELTLVLDASTQVIHSSSSAADAQLGVGSAVEAHYVEKEGSRRAILVVSGVSADPAARSKRPGRSYLGVVTKRKGHSVEMRVGTKTREVNVDSRTQLVDREGRPLGAGERSVLEKVLAGDTLLVKYEEQDDSTFVNDIYLPGSSRKAVEIRKLSDGQAATSTRPQSRAPSPLAR
jgi:hypothetical protein